jgi:two-component system nitrogen regulation sensor histidine kinase NtrY
MSDVTMAQSSAQPSYPGAPLEAATRPLARYVFTTLYVLSAAVTVVCTLASVGAPGSHPVSAPSTAILIVLTANLMIILGLAMVAGWRVLGLFGSKARDAAVRLHRRFVILFAVAAMAPAVIIALFFGLVVTQGMETWFSSRVRTVVDNATTVTKAYLKEQEAFIRDRMDSMATDLNRNVQGFDRSRMQFTAFLYEEAAARDMAAVYVIDGEGRVLARAEQSSAPPYLAPPMSAIAAAAQGDVRTQEFSSDYIRGLIRLKAYPDAYLYVARPFGEGIMAQLRRAQLSVLDYRLADHNRLRVQTIFILSYLSIALLVLVGAIWLGMTVAIQLAGPVARLVQAADRVAGGDLSVRVDSRHDPEEIAVLSRAFNRMTGDLQTQQAELRAAGMEAESRRRFIEAVLSGVSAGVIGLDPSGRISAVNARALTLLALGERGAFGRPLADVAPELTEVVNRASAAHDADAEIDLVRGAETRRLRVRASGRNEGGVVLTFDDITRLVTAQRNAAWRDVARRIAHEIKNPLTPIQLSAERIRRKYRREIKSDVETFDRCTDTIIRQVGDIGRMVDEFSSFARMPAPRFAAADAAELLRQACFSQRVGYPDIEVDCDVCGEAVPIMCDAGLTSQALLNVLKNAGEAVAARVASTPSPPGRIRAQLIADQMSVTFEIQDNGPGLPTKNRDRLTEPYVTTRDKGTGLGLAIVKRICEEHGGELLLGDADAPPDGLPGAVCGAKVMLRFARHSLSDKLQQARSAQSTLATA